MPSQQLDLLQRRVRFLDGKVAEVQRDFTALGADETAVLSRAGARERTGGQIARWLLTRNPGGFVATLADQELFRSRGDVAWDAFDRRWAQRTGPKVRTMMSALASLESLGGASHNVDIAAYPQAERPAATELWTRGNGLAREAARLEANWVVSPMSRYDTANRSGASRWLQRLFLQGNPLVVLRGATQRTLWGRESTAASQAEGITRAVGVAAQNANVATQQPSVSEMLNRPATLPPEAAAPDGSTGGSWWSGAVTAALLAAGGYLIYTIGKDIIAPTPSTASEQLED